MELKIKRYAFKDKYVIGRLFIGEVEFCHTMEPQNGVVGSNKGCIPVGSYRIRVDWSNKFKRNLPILLNVPGRDGIRIHQGNTAIDTTGCILVGDNMKVASLSNSLARLVELMRLIRKNDIHYINIV